MTHLRNRLVRATVAVFLVAVLAAVAVILFAVLLAYVTVVHAATATVVGCSTDTNLCVTSITNLEIGTDIYNIEFLKQSDNSIFGNPGLDPHPAY